MTERNRAAFVDIHCHILPGLDDGASTREEALAMARLAVSDGIATVIATPHQLGNYGENRGAGIREACHEFQSLLDAHGIPLRVLPGADVRIEPDLVRKVRDGDVLTLADQGRYVLLELPHELYFPLDRLLSQLGEAGLIGILSHPERNLGILSQPGVLEPLHEAGCLFQITAGSLVGTFGPAIRTFSEGLVRRGLVHFVATDAHGSRSRRPLIGRAHRRVASIAGDNAAAAVCCTNPARIVDDRIVRGRTGSPNERAQRGWFAWRRVG